MIPVETVLKFRGRFGCSNLHLVMFILFGPTTMRRYSDVGHTYMQQIDASSLDTYIDQIYIDRIDA